MKIKILQKSDSSLLIEWRDEEGLHRGVIPTGLVSGEFVDDAFLSLAIPHGIDWEYLLERVMRPVTPHDLAEALRNHGFWTSEDLRSRPSAVLGVLQEVYGVDFQKLLVVADSYKKDNRGG